MPRSPLMQKLQAIADDFSCGVWASPKILSPQRLQEKLDREFARQPGDATERRLTDCGGKWAVMFRRSPVPNARDGMNSDQSLETMAAFSPQEVRDMDPHDIIKVMIGVIAEREVHEVLEWSQLRSQPQVPIVNPHRDSADLEDVVFRLSKAILDHAT